MRADRGSQHGVDVQFADDAKQQSVNAGGVGIGQFGQVTYAHHDGDVRVFFTQGLIAYDGLRQSKMDRVQYGIGDKRLAGFLASFNGPV